MTTIALNIVKQVSPESNKPYRIFETYMTSEGPRSRICGGAFSTLESAEDWRDRLQSGEQ